MGLAVLTILLSVLGGTLLALLPRQNAGWMGPMRTFGLAAALAVVGLHMVPESIEAIGGWAVPALVLGLLLPTLLGRLGTRLWRATNRATEPRHVALEAGYAGLLLHKVGDGVALGVYAGDLHPGASSHGFAAALAAHIVPVVAIVVLTFDSVRGRGSALLRALGLALAGLLGVWLTRSVVVAEVSTAQGWLSAVAAGMLLHVVTHDLGHDLPKSRLGHALDFLMAVLGFFVSALGGEAHGESHSDSVAADLGRTLFALGACTVVYFALGAGVGAAWGRARLRLSSRLGPWLDSTFGVGLWVVEPVLAAETLLVSLAALGLSFTLSLVLGGLLLAGLLGRLLESTRRRQAPSEGLADLARLGFRGEDPQHFWPALDRRMLRRGALLGLGLFVAAIADVTVARHAELAAAIPGLPALAFVLLAGASAVATPAALPLALVFIDKGLPPAVAVAGLLLGPLLERVKLSMLSEALGTRKTALALGVTALLLLGLGVVSGGALSASEPVSPWAFGLTLGLVMTMLALGIWVRIVYWAGFRGFLLPLEGSSGHHHADPFASSPGHGIFRPGHAPGGGDGHVDCCAEPAHTGGAPGEAGLDASGSGLKIPEP